MKQYKYKAVNLEGKVIKGETFLGNEFEIVMELRNNKYFLTSLKESRKMFIKSRKIRSKELYIFSKQMAYMMNAGFNICESLNILKDKFQGNMQRLIIFIKKGVENGNSIYKSIDEADSTVPNFFKSMILIGEESGNLSEVFKNMAEHYKHQWRTEEKIKNAATYPTIVFVFTMLVLVFLVSRVIPKFIDTLNSLGGKLPKITEFLLNISYFIRGNFIIILVAILVCFVFIKKVMSIEKNRLKVDKLKFKLPLLKNIYKNKIALRFSSALYILIKSGIDVIKGMYIASEVLENSYGEKCIKDVIEELRNGESFREAFTTMEIFNNQAKDMFIMAEECGNIEEIMGNISELYKEQFNDDLKRIINFIEPCMIIILAVFVGTIIISSILPMINIMNSI